MTGMCQSQCLSPANDNDSKEYSLHFDLCQHLSEAGLIMDGLAFLLTL